MPVFKNDGERSDAGKYRTVNLLPIISKIFESFINDSLARPGLLHLISRRHPIRFDMLDC